MMISENGSLHCNTRPYTAETNIYFSFNKKKTRRVALIRFSQNIQFHRTIPDPYKKVIDTNNHQPNRWYEILWYIKHYYSKYSSNHTDHIEIGVINTQWGCVSFNIKA